MSTKKVLVIDDEKTVCDSVKKILSREGYTVEDSLNPKEAIKKIKMTSYDLVITDMKMPEVSGLELLEIVKDYYPEIEVILITGYPSFNTAKQAFRLGATEYLSKPFTPKELIEITKKAINKKKISIDINRNQKTKDIKGNKDNLRLATFYKDDSNNTSEEIISSEKLDNILKLVSGDQSIIDAKTRELIHIALAICAQRHWSLAYHVKNAFENGANRKEILFAASMAFSMSGGPGPSCITSLQEALALFDTKEESN